FPQENYKTTYNQLKEYEGLYEYINNITLEIAASPVDTLLYAIIDKSKYPLFPLSKDLFLNRQNDEIRFLRDDNNTIIGYIFYKDTLKLISKSVSFSDKMWYPRPKTIEKFNYTYRKPKESSDGLLIGNIRESGLDTLLLAKMVEKIADRTYPDVHSVLVIKDGKLVFEEYFYEYDENTLHELRSATKSFISALTGIAVDKGFIKSIDNKVLSFFPEYTIANNSD